MNIPKIENRCIQRGKPASDDNLHCPDYYHDRQAEIQAVFTSVGVNHLQSLREKGISIAPGGETGRKRGETQKTRIQAQQEWEKANPGRLEEEGECFIREIQPLLNAFSVREIKKACDCSLRYASIIKKGKYVPHLAFFEELEKAIKQKAK